MLLEEEKRRRRRVNRKKLSGRFYIRSSAVAIGANGKPWERTFGGKEGERESLWLLFGLRFCPILKERRFPFHINGPPASSFQLLDSGRKKPALCPPLPLLLLPLPSTFPWLTFELCPAAHHHQHHQSSRFVRGRGLTRKIGLPALAEDDAFKRSNRPPPAPDLRPRVRPRGPTVRNVVN